MDDKKDRTALDSLEEFAQIQLEIAKLEATGRLAGAISKMVAYILIGGLLAAGLLCMSVALAMYLSELLGSYTYGFLTAAAIFLLVGLILYWLRKPMITGPLRNRIISGILKTDSE